MRKFKDITGQTFSRLSALRFISRSNKRTIWEFKCVCGQIVQKRLDMVTGGLIQSCGCLHRETGTKNGLKSRYTEGRPQEKPISDNCYQASRKPVVQMDQYDKVIKIHESLASAAKAVGTQLTCVSRICRHAVGKDRYQYRTTRGFQFMFLDEYLNRFPNNNLKQ